MSWSWLIRRDTGGWEGHFIGHGRLRQLAGLVRQRNRIEEQIFQVTRTPAEIGPVGEYIASEVFDIELNTRRNAKGDDGVFRSGPYAGQGVNVKWYSKHTGILDVNPHGVSHHYLVLTGPRAGGSPKTNPWLIREVYLFDGPTVVQHLVSRGCRVAEASSVLQEHWTEAMVYPHDRHPEYSLTEEQKTALALFA